VYLTHLGQDKIHGKLYGKQWVFVTRQEDLPAPSQAELNDMDAKMDALKAQLTGLKDDVFYFIYVFIA
jgi:hypothetical protein